MLFSNLRYLLREAPSVEAHFATRRVGRLRFTLFRVALLQVANQLKNALLRLPRTLFLLVPVRDGAAEVYSLHLLHKATDDLEVRITYRAHADEIYMNETDDISAGEASVFLRKRFVANA